MFVTSFASKILFEIFIPRIKADCCGETKSCIISLSLIAKTFVSDFKVEFIELIGRKSASKSALVFLGINAIKEELHPSGKKPKPWKFIKNRWTSNLISGHKEAIPLY